jgi:hypothetical protein
MFKQSVEYILSRQGILSTYTRVVEGVYDVETSSVTNTSTNYTVKMYMKHQRANQYNFPNLIGKEVGLFYISAASLPFTPEPQDLITFNGKVYKIDSVQSHSADGQVILHRILGVI